MKLALQITFFLSLLVVVHVLNNQVCGAEVNETSARVHVFKEWRQQLDQFLLPVVVKDQVLFVFDNLVPLFEGLVPVLSTHVGFEFAEVAAGDVDQIVLVNSSWLVVAGWIRCLLRQ